MENEKLRITLSNPEKVYSAGETIKGEIWLNLAKRTKIRAIKVQITGKGKCKWMEILRKNSNNESARSLFYSSKEIYAHNEHTLPVFEPRGIELSPGEHTFEFTVPLEWNLPSSFKGSYGSIKYKLRLLIQRPWTFDERHIIPLTILKHMPLSSCYRSNPTSLEKQITKTISLFGTRPITMLALLPEDSAVRGEPLRICVTVTNNSTTNVEKLRFSVLQYIWYYSHVPLRVQKMECVTIANKETGAVHKKSERSFAHELMIPPTAQPTDDELSGVINISYELRVEAVLRGFFKNLVLNLPFKMYSRSAGGELNNLSGRPPRPPPRYGNRNSVSIGMVANITTSSAGNPFENSGTPLTVATYPSLDSSIGSPSHSSQYSESSSIHSITSDSSAATLSPAVCAAELSYASGTSSQFNSPSARASLRSSTVPYVMYPPSSSPLMINSYPPAQVPTYPPLSESPGYSLMQLPAGVSPPPPPPTEMPSPTASLTTTLPRQESSTSSTSAAARSSFLHGLHPPGAHEMPPSYEELFGSATAPPETPK
ncbi:PREDICTED: arrestin domain-containing protein 3 [Rhagoletis zephyria]|uniref:arrestin domain-containing protein 3 n=1 Tax=Rhagoletis zephyria TaxID=28612 RepID=UPI0008117CD0|nr:PREDICTED: arrestin domain-containing protein 3 [Rhagoletis zephyria]XP_017478399.1 PREDICTED: arrestin domain-containing protein 3 [Rhagoletis zephyria]